MPRLLIYFGLAYQLVEAQSSVKGTNVFETILFSPSLFKSIHIDSTWPLLYTNVLPNNMDDGLVASYITSRDDKRVPFVGVIFAALFVEKGAWRPFIKSLTLLILTAFGYLPLWMTYHRKASISIALANLYVSSIPSRPKYHWLPYSLKGLTDNLSR